MLKKKVTIIILAVSIFGFLFAFYAKFLKTYELTNYPVSTKTVMQLSLSENIAFFEKLSDTEISFGISGNDNLPKAIKRLKTINIVAIAGMSLFLLLFLWTLRSILFGSKKKIMTSSIIN